MTLHVLSNYTPADATHVNDMSNEILTASLMNTIRTLIDRTVSFSAGYLDCFAEAYIDSNGRENTVDLTTSMAVFDTNKYNAIIDSDQPYVIIEATSISAISDFEINNCGMFLISAGRWMLFCHTGTAAVRRAQIYKTLFYGLYTTPGATPTPRASSTYITGITAIKTNITRDVGKRAHYALNEAQSDIGNPGTYTGTFVDTTNNLNCSSWSFCQSTSTGEYGQWEMPSGTTLNSATENTTSNELGVDTTADELNNPATCQLEVDANEPQTGRVKTIILCSGDITWATGGGASTRSNVDFYTDNGIPALTASTENINDYNYVVHTIPTGRFPATVSSAICVPLIKDWETGADIQFKLTNATEDSGWLEVMGTTTGKPAVQTFTAFTSEPTSLIVKLIPKTSSPTAGYPSILGVGCIAN